MTSSAFTQRITGAQHRGWLTDLATALLSRLDRNLTAKEDARLLHRLDDHLLRDMGLNRGDIDFAVRYGHLPDR